MCVKNFCDKIHRHRTASQKSIFNNALFALVSVRLLWKRFVFMYFIRLSYFFFATTLHCRPSTIFPSIPIFHGILFFAIKDFLSFLFIQKWGFSCCIERKNTLSSLVWNLESQRRISMVRVMACIAIFETFPRFYKMVCCLGLELCSCFHRTNLSFFSTWIYFGCVEFHWILENFYKKCDSALLRVVVFSSASFSISLSSSFSFFFDTSASSVSSQALPFYAKCIRDDTIQNVAVYEYIAQEKTP